MDANGAITRGDTRIKELSLVFTGDEFADGADTILAVLKKKAIPASFFLTGNFYRNPAFKNLIWRLKNSGHYLGAHSDKHLLYADWKQRDSLLISQKQFKQDLKANYGEMKRFGLRKSDAHYFLPPYEWYNKTIAKWTNQEGLRLVNFTPGTRSTADYTYPEMGKSYRSSEEIYRSIMDYEQNSSEGLNGFILLVHIGTDPRRKDKFYLCLDELIGELKAKGYGFVRINELIE